MSASVELEAWMVMTAMFGLGLALSNVKSIFRPFLLYAVIGGIPTDFRGAENQRALGCISLNRRKLNEENKDILPKCFQNHEDKSLCIKEWKVKGCNRL